MKSDDRRAALIAHIVDLDEDEALALVRQRIAAGDDPLEIMEDARQGMQRVGKRYEQGLYYIAGLIMAGEIFRELMELVQPVVEAQVTGHASGCILLGTVQGDIHDIGKNIVNMLLRCHGFTVHDLGVDVPPSQFIARIPDIQPDIVGLSGLLTSTYATMRETVALVRAETQHAGRHVPIIIGGGQLDEQVCQYVGADYWTDDAMEGVRLCQRLVAGP